MVANGVVAMHQVEDGNQMEQNTNPQLDRRIRTFTTGLKKDFAGEIAQNPSGFRSRVVGKVRAGLPRERPGRKASQEIKEAAELYLNLYTARGVPGNWNEIAKRLVPGYAGLSVEMQRYHHYRLRSQTHSYLYDQRSRLRRSASTSETPKNPFTK
jgi:hypothetical protein